MSRFAELAARWRADAERLRLWDDERGARMLERCAEQLAGAERQVRDEPLTLEQAATESGYSADRLRHMVADGIVPNAGRRGAPRIRRGDLPVKPGARAAHPSRGFDAAAAAASILGGSR